MCRERPSRPHEIRAQPSIGERPLVQGSPDGTASGTSLPGFMMSVRIERPLDRAQRVQPRRIAEPRRARRSFIWPMPCSAEIEPPAAVTRSWTIAADRLRLRSSTQRSARRPRARARGNGRCRRRDGRRRSTLRAREARLDRGRGLDHEVRPSPSTGTEMSCLAAGPSRAPPRRSNRAAARTPRPGPRWRRSPRPRPARVSSAERRPSEQRLGGLGAAIGATASISTFQACARRAARACRGHGASTSSSALAGTSSKLSIASPSRRLELAQQRQRRGRRRRRPTQATARSPIAGTSRRLAAVTMPSVPFGADQQLLEIVAAIVLLERGQPVEQRCRRAAPPRARARARASCRSAAPGCRRHWSRRGRRSSPSPWRRASAGSARPAAAPPRADRRGSPRPRRPRCPPRRRGARIAVHAAAATAAAPRPLASGRRAADHRGVAALRHERHARLGAKRDHRRDLSPRRRREQGRGRGHDSGRASRSATARVAPGSRVKPLGRAGRRSLSSRASQVMDHRRRIRCGREAEQINRMFKLCAIDAGAAMERPAVIRVAVAALLALASGGRAAMSRRAAAPQDTGVIDLPPADHHLASRRSRAPAARSRIGAAPADASLARETRPGCIAGRRSLGAGLSARTASTSCSATARGSAPGSSGDCPALDYYSGFYVGRDAGRHDLRRPRLDPRAHRAAMRDRPVPQLLRPREPAN